MGPRIYPSYQDTNTTAKGSLIINYLDIFPNAYNDYIQVSVNGQLRNRDYNEINGLYRTNLNIGDVVLIELTSDIVLFKNITVYRRDYTTDDNAGDNGITDTLITFNNDNNTTINITFTATTVSDSYNFEYRVEGSVGTNPSVDCEIVGFSADFDGNYTVIGLSGTTDYLKYSSNGYYIYEGLPRQNPINITSPLLIQDFTLNYYGNIINYISYSGSPKYLINPNSFLDVSVTPFSSSTISYDPLLLNWSTMDCSNDGKYQALGQVGGSLFVSSNSGTTYSTVTSSVKNWKVVRVPNNSGFPFYASTSSNGDFVYKITSTSTYSTLSANAKSLSGTSISDFAISRNSKYVFICPNSGTTIMVSSDSGSTFSNVSTGISMVDSKIAISSSGKIIYLINTNTFKYSNDYGQTWNNAPATEFGYTQCISINCSGTGRYVYFGTYDGFSYRLYNSIDYLLTYEPSILSPSYPVVNVVKPNKN